MSDSKFQISLRENGEHSIKKSLESYSEYEKTKDQMLLKDAILFLHNGIELLMKEMLVRENEYLIFVDLKDVKTKQKEARKKGLGIFFIEYPPKSVTYEEAYERVEAFINPPELNETLLKYLGKLNRLRNQLEHYAIDADKEEVVQLLEAIHKPILNLFEKHLGPLTQLQTPQIIEAWQSITNSQQLFKRVNHEVAELIRKFNGQKVSGSLFGLEGKITLPKFDSIIENDYINVDGVNGSMQIGVDIFASSIGSAGKASTKWVVETRPAGTQRILLTIQQLSFYAKQTGSIPWLVIFDNIPDSARKDAKNLNVMTSNRQDFETLSQLVTSPF